MAYSKTQKKRDKAQHEANRSETSNLAILCALSLIALGAFVVIKMVPTGNFTIGQLFSFQKTPPKTAVSLGGVKLGSTLDTVHKMQPTATQDVSASGAITMAFADEGAAYMVWYAKTDTQTIAYKARQSRIIEGVSEDEFVGQLTTKYGPPSLATCSRRVTNGIRDCHFSWWIPKDIRLDLTSRQLSKLKGSALHITTQITDTRVALNLQRSARNLTRSKRLLKASSVKVF
ncbi:MAG: hypothetical protein JKY17_08255 [Magnetovibrio sp.]|nr:hypothetical protein [Magnetovibrio sp.]